MTEFGSTLIRTLEMNNDGLILINGLWGSGKTFYLKNTFKNLYNKPLFYISVLGVNNLKDFKEKVISVTYLSNYKEVEKAKEIIEQTINTHQKNNIGSLIKNGFNLFSGAMQEKVMSDLEGVFIIDDIERIETPLMQEILTYCLQNKQQKMEKLENKIDYIIVGNFSSENNININHKEKIISDEVFFKGNNTDPFIEKYLSSKIKNNREIIKKGIKNYNIKNLRTIKKIIIKINQVFDIAKSEDKINTQELISFIDTISSGIILKEKFNFTHEKFLEYERNAYERYFKEPDDKTSEIDKEINRLVDIIQYQSYREKVYEYIFNMISIKDIFNDIFTKRKSISADEYLNLPFPSLLQIDTDIYCEELKKTILRKNSPSLNIWLKAVNNYEQLLKNRYIPRITGITKMEIMKSQKSFTDKDISEYIESKFTGVTIIEKHFFDSSTYPQEKYFVDKYFNNKRSDEISSIIDKTINKGWLSVGVEITKTDYKYKLLETIKPSNIIKGIVNTWKPLDIIDFSNHLRTTYNFSNISDYLSGEMPHLIILNKSISRLLKKSEPSFKTGALMELQNEISEIINRLDSDIKRHDRCAP